MNETKKKTDDYTLLAQRIEFFAIFPFNSKCIGAFCTA